MASTFAELQQELYPRWCRRPRMASLIGAGSAQLDVIAQWAAAALTARFLRAAPDDALPYIAGNWGLVRAPGETTAAFRAYLAGARAIWRSAGTPARIVAECARIGCTAQVITWLDLATGGNPGAFGGTYTSFAYLLITTGPFATPPAFDADDHTFDGSGGAGPATGVGGRWDLAETLAGALDWLLLVLRTWKPAAVSFRYIEFSIGGATVRVPVREQWELLPDGSAHNLYNDGY